MLQEHLIDELLELTQELGNSTLDNLAHSLGLEEYHPQIKDGLTIYYKLTNKPVICRLCGKNGNWVSEGPVLVCDHTKEANLGVPMRVVDSVKIDDVYIREE